MDHRRDVRAVPIGTAVPLDMAMPIDTYVDGTAPAESSLTIPLPAIGVRTANMSSTVGGLGDIPTQANGPPISGLECLHG
jgi:hypothetical protein